MTGKTMKCPDCGAVISIHLVKGGRRFYAHCTGCGRMQFGPAESLERLTAGALYVCTHGVELTPCKRGFTSWCPICRVRTFTYQKP